MENRHQPDVDAYYPDQAGLGVEKKPRRFYGVPWPEQGAIIFDLTRVAPPRTRPPNLSAEDILRAYEVAAAGSLIPVSRNAPFGQFASVPPSSIIEAHELGSLPHNTYGSVQMDGRSRTHLDLAIGVLR